MPRLLLYMLLSHHPLLSASFTSKDSVIITSRSAPYRLEDERRSRGVQRRNHTCTMSSAPADDLFQPTVTLTSAAAEKAMAAAEREASSNGWCVTIAIADAGGVPLLVKRCDGAFAASYEVATGKAKTAAHFCKPTAQLEAAANVTDGTSRSALLSAPFVLMRGGVPIFVNGKCCGAVGVSGVAPDQDEQVALAAVNAIVSIASKL